MKYLSLLVLTLCLHLPGLCQSTNASPDLVPDGLVRSVVQLDTDDAQQSLSFAVEKPAEVVFPERLASRIFSETVRTVTDAVSPVRQIPLRLKLTLRLGQKMNHLNINHGSNEETFIVMGDWDEITFSRFLVRAVRSSLLTETQMDDLAAIAMRRAINRVSVAELQKK